MLSQDAQMLLSFCFCFVFTDVIKYYTSLEGNLDSISCPRQYRAAQTLACQPQSRIASQTKARCKATVIFPLGFESAFLRVFLIHIKSGFNNPLAPIRARYCDDTESRSGGVCHRGWSGLWSLVLLFLTLGKCPQRSPGIMDCDLDRLMSSIKSHRQYLHLKHDHTS